jgi:hypothetical protein
MYGVLFPLSNYMPFSGLTSPESPAGRVLRCPQFLLICLAPTGVILSACLSLFYWIMATTRVKAPAIMSRCTPPLHVSPWNNYAPVEGAWQNPDVYSLLSHICFVTKLLITACALKVKERKITWTEIRIAEWLRIWFLGYFTISFRLQELYISRYNFEIWID